MDEPVRRRRRVRHLPAAETVAQTSAQTSAQITEATDETWPGDAVDGDVSHAERGLRGLVGSGSSQVAPSAALRARDAARPSPADLDRAEAQLVLVRRHWVPRD